MLRRRRKDAARLRWSTAAGIERLAVRIVRTGAAAPLSAEIMIDLYSCDFDVAGGSAAFTEPDGVRALGGRTRSLLKNCAFPGILALLSPGCTFCQPARNAARRISGAANRRRDACESRVVRFLQGIKKKGADISVALPSSQLSFSRPVRTVITRHWTSLCMWSSVGTDRA